MLFNSVEFVIFVAVLAPLYYLMADIRSQHGLLVLGSIIFYCSWNVHYISLLLLVVLVADFTARRIERVGRSDISRKLVLYIGVAVSLVILGVFKYYNFFVDVMVDLGVLRLEYARLLLPLGISFYTFQAISYMVDVYRRDIAAEQNTLRVFLYISFFPQLIAGPIVRASRFLPQLEIRKSYCSENMRFGLQKIFVGVLKKVVVADSMAGFVDPIYSNPSVYSGFALLLATYAFAVQIYCDFSGYSDIAIGVARIFGFRLGENFNSPYLSGNLQEFWRRWHISLSSWLRDYLYVPLGGSRKGVLKTYRNLLFTMLLGGLWHGASYNFIIWGAMHGIWLSVERAVLKNQPEKRKKFSGDIFSITYDWLKVVLVFNGVCLTWVFFRAAELDDAIALLSRIAILSNGVAPNYFDVVWLLMLLLLVGVWCLIANKIDSKSIIWFPLVVVGFCMLILFGASSGEFIYFVF